MQSSEHRDVEAAHQESVQFSGGLQASSPTGDCSIIIRQPRNSGVLVLESRDRHVQLDLLKEYLSDSSRSGPATDTVTLASTIARLTHDSWHAACTHNNIRDKSTHCYLQDALPCLVEPSLFIECDIGLASAAIRGWHDLYISHIPLARWDRFKLQSTTSPLPLSLSNLRLEAVEFEAQRTAHITPTNTIRDPYTVFPRRLWDLHTNRVVPAHLCRRNTLQGPAPPLFVAISHSWRPQSELVYVETPINAFAWPVPLPAGLDLEDLRAEIQAHMPTYYRYVWLDVLCLRQAPKVPAGATRISPAALAAQRRHRDSWVAALSLARDSDGSLRSSELAIDVPTIGNVYRLATKVLRYLNGLGQPLSLTGWDLPTHWLNRAWTLQEHVPQSVDLGVAHIRGDYRDLKVAKGGRIRYVGAHLRAVYDSLVVDDGYSGTGPTLLGLVAEMGRRFAANEVDKVAGLSYALQLKELPTYAGTAAVEAAWRRCLAVLPPRYIAELFFKWPLAPVYESGSPYTWIPTWEALVGLPPRPYAAIPKDVDAGSVLQATGASGRGSMRANVACVFPRSIAHVVGTDIDYVVDMRADTARCTCRMAGGQLWRMVVANTGLPRVDLSGATGRWLMALWRLHKALFAY